MKVAYICEPQIGGTYTSFRQVREQLLPKGIDYRCVPPVDGKAFANTRFAHDEGVDFIEYPHDEPAAMARRLVDHLQAEQFSAVVILPGCYPWVSSLPPFLPREIRCLARMPHNGRGVYQPTALMAAHYDRIIAVAPRLRDDLVATYGVPPGQVEIIANGVDTERFYPGPEANAQQAIFVGRLEDLQKDVFFAAEDSGLRPKNPSGSPFDRGGCRPGCGPPARALSKGGPRRTFYPAGAGAAGRIAGSSPPLRNLHPALPF